MRHVTHNEVEFWNTSDTVAYKSCGALWRESKCRYIYVDGCGKVLLKQPKASCRKYDALMVSAVRGSNNQLYFAHREH